MRKKLVAVLVGLLVLTQVSLVPLKANTLPELQGKALETTVAAQADSLTSMLGATSVQYALIDEGEIVLSGQSGVYSTSGEGTLSSNTLYGIGSVSKMYVTAAVMKLVDEGKVDLDTPVTTYIPEFTMKDERYKAITPRMLLNHSSGLMGSSFKNAFLFNDADSYAVDHLLEQLKDQRLKADPGTFSVYCNDGFTLAQILVERVSGKDFTTFIHETFTKPLNLTQTKTPQDTFDTQLLAKAYFPTYQGELPIENVNVIGTGGIYTTAEELCRFAEIFMYGQTEVLSEAALKAMEMNEAEKGIWVQDGDSAFQYGLGWDHQNAYPFNTYDIQALVKGGDTQLYHSSLIVLPEYDMAAVVLSSGGASVYNQMLATNMLLEQLKAKGVIETIQPTKIPTPPVKGNMPQALMDQSGIYMGMGMTYEVQIKETGELVLKSLTVPAPEQIFTYTSEGVFKSPDGSMAVQIVEESNGHQYLWAKGYNVLPGLGEMPVSDYQIQKVEPNQLSEEVHAKWQARNGKKYFILDEKYTSQSYFTMPAVVMQLNEHIPGYVLGNKIIDAYTAQSSIQIPGMNGRDLQDIEVFEEEGVEYAKIGGYLTMSEDTMQALASTSQAICTIGDKGYTRWFTIPDNMAQQSMACTLPQAGAIMVYNQQGQLVENTYLTGHTTITLPDGGYIAFVGDAGVQFQYEVMQSK